MNWRALLAVALVSFGARADFPVVFGASWDSIPLQQILDEEYGVGAIDVLTEYEGFHPADADPPYWEDSMLNGLIVREIAGHAGSNEFGWYLENFAMPIIDSFNDGIVFAGSLGAGESVQIDLPGGVTRFGFYLNPNGSGSSNNAPEPEIFFTNRAYNDIGADGLGGVFHLPDDGDPQCLIYNVTHLRQGVPTFVLAWEDLDYGGEISPVIAPDKTDNDFNDLVLEISASSPVKTDATSFGQIKALYRR